MIDLTEIQPTTEAKPPRLVIYGPNKIGKSSFAAQSPNNIFFDIEHGLDGIESAKLSIEKYGDVIEGLKALHEQDHKFETLTIDSADWLERLIFNQVAAEHNKESIEDIGYGKGYMFALDHWNQVLSGLTSLRDKKNMTIILLCHEQIIRFNDPTMDSYDRYNLKLHNKASALVCEWADAILFARKKVRIEKEDQGFNNKKAKAKDIGDQRILQTTETASVVAGHRSSLALPDEITLSWNAFMEAVGTRQNKKEVRDE